MSSIVYSVIPDIVNVFPLLVCPYAKTLAATGFLNMIIKLHNLQGKKLTMH